MPESIKEAIVAAVNAFVVDPTYQSVSGVAGVSGSVEKPYACTKSALMFLARISTVGGSAADLGVRLIAIYN